MRASLFQVFFLCCLAAGVGFVPQHDAAGAVEAECTVDAPEPTCSQTHADSFISHKLMQRQMLVASEEPLSESSPASSPARASSLAMTDQEEDIAGLGNGRLEIQDQEEDMAGLGNASLAMGDQKEDVAGLSLGGASLAMAAADTEEDIAGAGLSNASLAMAHKHKTISDKEEDITGVGKDMDKDMDIDMEIRALREPLPFHEHPRIFFSSEEIPEVRQRLLNTEVGKEALKQLRTHSILMLEGRHNFERRPFSDRYFAPESTHPKSRISNLGLWDTSAAFSALVSGDLGQATQWRTKLGPTGASVAMEAFLCHIETTGVSEERRRNVAKAVGTWGKWAPSDTEVSWRFGYQWALAYDLAHPWMTSEERAHARKAVTASLLYYSKMLTDERFNGEYYGAGLEAEAVTSNWATLDSFMPIMICAVEGELSTEADGVDWPRVQRYFEGAMKSLKHFQMYGFWKTGAPYEGQGKNYMFAAHQIAFAKRGFNTFQQQSAKAYGSRWLTRIVQPYGYSSFAYDVLGGSGAEPVRGGYNVITQDHIGLKFMYPSDARVDYMFRNVVLSEATHKDSGESYSYIDVGEGKFPARADKYNNLLMLAIFASDFQGEDSDSFRRAAMEDKLDYLDEEGGTLIARSDWSSEATTLQVHIRQDFGGHTHADRNSFSLSALGRIFIPILSTARGQAAYMQYPEFNGETLVDGLASKVNPQDGAKMRIPAKIAAWSPLQQESSFITGDATYSYSNEYVWNPYYKDTDMSLRDSCVGEEATFNDFRRSNNKITESKVGDVGFSRYPHWSTPGQLEGIQKKSYNPMQEVLRTSGLVRGGGKKPYVLVFEDIRKDGALHNFTWHFPIASDLEVQTGDSLPRYSYRDSDVVLADPSGQRNLLIRILQAKGEHGRGLLAYRDELVNAYGEKRHRLVIQREKVNAPEFLLLLFPFKTGEPLPHSNWRDGSILTIRQGTQYDVYRFSTRTVSTSVSRDAQGLQPAEDKTFKEFVLHRNDNLMLDYRGQIEPMPLQSLWRCTCEVQWMAYGRLQRPKHLACDIDTQFDFNSHGMTPKHGCEVWILSADGQQVDTGSCYHPLKPNIIHEVIRTCPRQTKQKASCSSGTCTWTSLTG